MKIVLIIGFESLKY